MICTLFWIFQNALFPRVFLSSAAITTLIKFPKQVCQAPGSQESAGSALSSLSSQGLAGPAPGQGSVNIHSTSNGCRAAGNRTRWGVGESGRRDREAPFSPEATSPEETPGVLLHVNGLLSGGIAWRNGLPRKPLQGHFMCFSHRLLQGPEKAPCTVIRWAGRGDIADPTREVNQGPRTHVWAQTELSGWGSQVSPLRMASIHSTPLGKDRWLGVRHWLQRQTHPCPWGAV